MDTRENTKHTPGPWTIDTHDFDPWEIFANNRRVGTIMVDNAGDHNDPEDVANARLIAAAPDLLEAAKAARSALAAQLDGENDHPLLVSVYEMLDAAIAKARL